MNSCDLCNEPCIKVGYYYLLNPEWYPIPIRYPHYLILSPSHCSFPRVKAPSHHWHQNVCYSIRYANTKASTFTAKNGCYFLPLFTHLSLASLLTASPIFRIFYVVLSRISQSYPFNIPVIYPRMFQKPYKALLWGTFECFMCPEKVSYGWYT